jgi:hypothetical protein
LWASRRARRTPIPIPFRLHGRPRHPSAPISLLSSSTAQHPSAWKLSGGDRPRQLSSWTSAAPATSRSWLDPPPIDWDRSKYRALNGKKVFGCLLGQAQVDRRTDEGFDIPTNQHISRFPILFIETSKHARALHRDKLKLKCSCESCDDTSSMCHYRGRWLCFLLS